jgi:hypothetical protein
VTFRNAVGLYTLMLKNGLESGWADDRAGRFFIELGRWRFWNCPRSTWREPWPNDPESWGIKEMLGGQPRVAQAVQWAFGRIEEQDAERMALAARWGHGVGMAGQRRSG